MCTASWLDNSVLDLCFGLHHSMLQYQLTAFVKQFEVVTFDNLLPERNTVRTVGVCAILLQII